MIKITIYEFILIPITIIILLLTFKFKNWKYSYLINKILFVIASIILLLWFFNYYIPEYKKVKHYNEIILDNYKKSLNPSLNFSDVKVYTISEIVDDLTKKPLNLSDLNFSKIEINKFN